MPTVPPLKRFNMPQLLEIVESLGCRQEHLLEYLQSGDLNAVCYPYRHKPEKAVPIEPDQWRRMHPGSYGFSVYDGWLGDEDISELGRKDPVHVVPDAVDHLLEEVDDDDQKIVTAAVVFLIRDEFVRFVAWLDAKSADVPALIAELDSVNVVAAKTASRSKPRRGAPSKHDYTNIDEALRILLEHQGKRAFARIGEVRNILVPELGKDNLPPDSTLGSHIRAWKKRHLGA